MPGSGCILNSAHTKPYHSSEDEKELVDMNQEKHNPTNFTMLQLLGIQRAMERGLDTFLKAEDVARMGTSSEFRKVITGI